MKKNDLSFYGCEDEELQKEWERMFYNKDLNMKKEKLTMCQIARKVALGEIPEGYEIDWFREAPGEVIDDRVAGEAIEIDRDDVPVPERVIVKGRYEVNWERYMRWDTDEEEEKVDFGKVTLFTRFVIGPVKFIYGKKDEEKLKGWLESNYDLGRTGLMKKDLVFNVKYEYGDVKRRLMDMMFTNVNYGEKEIEADMECEFMTEI